MVQKENRGGFRASIIVSAGEAVQGVIPQRMPERSGMGAYLMPGTSANAATRKGQPHAMKLRICLKGWQVELWAVKIIQGKNSVQRDRPVSHSSTRLLLRLSVRRARLTVKSSSSRPASRAT